jgi:hypothetical protein
VLADPASALSLAYARGHEPHRPGRAHRRGTTAIVGIAGFWSTVHVTGRQIRSGRDAKLWDARAAVYIDVLTVLDFLDVRTYDQNLDYEPEWDRLEARLAVFGSAAVFSAMQASRKAHEQLDLAVTRRSDERFERAIEAAADADNRLIELVRTELHSKSEPLPDVREQS